MIDREALHRRLLPGLSRRRPGRGCSSSGGSSFSLGGGGGSAVAKAALPSRRTTDTGAAIAPGSLKSDLLQQFVNRLPVDWLALVVVDDPGEAGAALAIAETVPASLS